jgi:hypothetical protein
MHCAGEYGQGMTELLEKQEQGRAEASPAQGAAMQIGVDSFASKAVFHLWPRLPTQV